MTELERQRQAYDRRQRAWVYLVLGALVTWLSFAGIGSETIGWKVLGYVAIVVGLAGVFFGIRLFQRPRP